MKTSVFALFCLLCVVLGEKSRFGNAGEAISFLLPRSVPKRPPVQKIEVIGAGFGRTGTKSLKTALNMLGYETYHMDQVFGFHEDLVTAAYNGGEKEFKAWMEDIMKHGYSATTDFPPCSFYKEQMEMFPEAKVILTQRDPDRWFKSFETLMWSAGIFGARPFSFMAPTAEFLRNSLGTKNGTKGVPHCVPKEEDFDWYQPWYFPWIKVPVEMHLKKEACIQSFNDHYAEVRKIVPKEKLLDFSVGEGWEPLCKHLGKPIPEQPFPNTNTSEDMTKMRRVLEIIAYIYPLIIFFCVAVLYFTAKLVINCFSAPKKLKTS